MIVCLGALAALACFSVFCQLQPMRILFAEDQALSFAVGSRVAQGELVLLGPPSHIGGRHLGPWLYYLTAAALKLSGGGIEGALKICALLQLTGLALLAALSSCITSGRERWAALVATTAALGIGNYLDVAFSFWHSNLLLIPALITFVAGYLLLAYGAAFLPLYFFAASLTFQLHFSSLPLLAAFGLVWLCNYRKNECAAGWVRLLGARPAQAMCVAAGACSWIPALVYETSLGGNVGHVLGGMQQASAHAGLREALGAVKHFIARFFAGGVLVEGTPLPKLMLWGMLAGAVLLLWLAYRRAAPALKRTAWAIVVALILYVLMLQRQAGPLYDYYLYALLPLPALCTGLAVSGALALLRNKDSAGWVRGCAGVFILVLLYCCAAFALGARTGPYPQARHRVYTLGFARDVAQALREDAQREPRVEQFSIVGFNALKLTRDSLYYFLGPAFFSRMHYWERFAEFAPQRAEGAHAYLVVCPKLDWKSMRKLDGVLAQDWELGEYAAMPGCANCRACLVRRMRKRLL